MQIFPFPSKDRPIILALGAESAGNFSMYSNGKIYFSQNFGDLLEENNFTEFKKAVLGFLKKEKLTPDIILTDLHPLMKTTSWGEVLAKKFKAEHIQVQHHHAHIFSTVGEYIIQDTKYKIRNTIYGIAMDGTGYGEDEKIWGGEVFKVTLEPSPLEYRGRCPVLRTEGVCIERIGLDAGSIVPLEPHSSGKIRYQNKATCIASDSALPEIKSSGGTPEPAFIQNSKFKISRIGHLENQALLGGELAIREPARMLIGILNKFLDKKEIYNFVKKYYTQNEFELLFNQLQSNFNCLETSSTGRVLDAMSVLLGFCGNERKYKHEPIDLLEKNSTESYANLKPKITQNKNGQYILDTTSLFNYVINYLHKDKHRLAATAQLYIAEGLHEIIKLSCHPERSPYSDKDASSGVPPELADKNDIPNTKYKIQNIFLSGGLAENHLIKNYFISQGLIENKKSDVPRGDAGISFGQIVYFLST